MNPFKGITIKEACFSALLYLILVSLLAHLLPMSYEAIVYGLSAADMAAGILGIAASVSLAFLAIVIYIRMIAEDRRHGVKPSGFGNITLKLLILLAIYVLAAIGISAAAGFCTALIFSAAQDSFAPGVLKTVVDILILLPALAAAPLLLNLAAAFMTTRAKFRELLASGFKPGGKRYLKYLILSVVFFAFTRISPILMEYLPNRIIANIVMTVITAALVGIAIPCVFGIYRSTGQSSAQIGISKSRDERKGE
ncbi:MAG: hypothetical protein LBQ21_06415 [Clostridiales Family XIII bacterium]|nr:hypothetical protein [Clostridiales Family XIII bacterium]